MTLCFDKFKDKKGTYIFFGCMLIGSAFEYLCSFFQEAAFGTVSWYYTASNLGIGDRISILYAVFWGALGIFWIKMVYPFLSEWIEKIPNKFGKALTICVAIFLSFDMLYSCMAVYRQTERRNGVPATSAVQHYFDRHYPDDVLKQIYPNMIVK